MVQETDLIACHKIIIRATYLAEILSKSFFRRWHITVRGHDSVGTVYLLATEMP